MNIPTKGTKLFFWIILGLFSTFFAEVIAGSSPYPFFSIFDILIVIPLYFLHTLFFITIIYRFGKPTLPALYTAGMLFGMYEAYLTKVIWTSYSATGPILSIGGIALFETALLVLFWHAIFAFILPVFLGESYLTKSNEIIGLLPKKIIQKGKLITLIFIIFGGAFTSVNSPNILQSLASPLLNGSVIVLLMYIWKRTGKDQYAMRDLMPSKKAFKIICILMIAMYGLYTLLLNFDKLPGILPQGIVLVMYGLLIWLFIRVLKKSNSEKITKEEIVFSWKKIIGLFALFVGVAVIAEVVNTFFVWTIVIWIIISHIGSIYPGLFLLFHAIKKAISHD